MVNSFENKVAIITGGASGIGEATALKFIEKGSYVAIIDVQEEKAVSVINRIHEMGGKAAYFNCDLTREEEVKNTIQKIFNQFGRIDYAYNNAGIGGQFAKLQDYPTDDWDKVISINLKAVFLCMKYEIPYLLQQQKTAIVNCASVLSVVAYENDSAYVASKFGVLGLTKNAALEYAKTG